MTDRSHIFDIVQHIDQPTVFYGDAHTVVAGMRDAAFNTSSVFMEISSPTVSPAALDAILQLDDIQPVYVLFNDFDCAEANTQQDILQFMTLHDHERSIVIAFIHGPPPSADKRPSVGIIYNAKNFHSCVLVEANE